VSPRLVAIQIDGEVSTHASGDGSPGGYAALCGLDGNDPAIQQQIAPLTSDVIDCATCRALWEAWHKYKTSDFKSTR
jgi:hypothetical protein